MEDTPEVTGPGLAEQPKSRVDRYLGYIPQALASHAHIVWLLLLGIYLIVLPLLGVPVSAKSELIGGNYTNVTSDIGACIAAGGTLTLLKHSRRRNKLAAASQELAQASHRIIADLYQHHTGLAHPEAISPEAGD
jgi:hypothetical protein